MFINILKRGGVFLSGGIENREALTSQLVHAAFFALLLSYVSYNGCALDNLIRK